jgi:hypothetical protein
VERQQERIADVKKFFSNMGKVSIFIAGGVALLFLVDYIVSMIDFPAIPEPTQIPIGSNLSTATLALPTSTSLSTSTSRPV